VKKGHSNHGEKGQAKRGGKASLLYLASLLDRVSGKRTPPLNSEKRISFKLSKALRFSVEVLLNKNQSGKRNFT